MLGFTGVKLQKSYVPVADVCVHSFSAERPGPVVVITANIHGDECFKVCKKNLLILDHINQTELSKFYNICDLFVFPSIYETGPQVVLEARSCGAVCIVSKDGGGKRIKKNREDGIILDNQFLDVSSRNWSVNP